MFIIASTVHAPKPLTYPLPEGDREKEKIVAKIELEHSYSTITQKY
jgi:hypothetical protein